MFPPEVHTSANSLSFQVYSALNFNCWHIYASHTRRLRLQAAVTLQLKARQGAQLWLNVPSAAQNMKGGDSCPLDKPTACPLSPCAALKYSELQ